MKKIAFFMAVSLMLFVFLPTLAEASTFIDSHVTSNTTWDISGSPYVISGNINVNAGFTLTIEPGTVVKFGPSGSLTVNGSLVADGTTLNPIYFTSLNDDTADGEDTNADGPSVGAPGDWYYLNFGANSSNNLLNNVVVRYGGYGSYGSVYIATSSMTVENSTITQSNGQGIRLQASSGDGTIRIIDNDIIGNAGRGIWVYYSNGDFDIDIEGNTVFDNGQEGIYIGNSTVRTFDIINNSITENGYDGIFVSNSTATGVSGDFAFINIDNNTIADNGYYGIRAISSTLSVTANEIFGHTDPYDGIYLDGDSFLNSTVAPNSPTPPDNNIHDNDLNVIIIGGTLSQAATWSSGTYVVDNLTVANTGSLTLAPGVVVKFNQYGSLDINGSLVADGTTLNPIYFTSLNDDTADGEDTNADGPSVGAPGDWYYLNFGANSSNNLLNNVVVRYGGYGSYGSVYIATSSMTVENSTITQSNGQGIRLQASSGDGTIRIIDNDIIGNAGRGIWVYYSNGDFDIDIEGNTVFDNGQEGIYIGNSTVRTFDIINNSITENGYDGISVNNSTATGVSGDFAFINIDNNTIADNGYYGIRAISSTLSVTANEIFGHTDPYDGIYLDGDSFLNSTVAPNSPTPPDNNIHDNDLNVIIIGGTLSQAATWSSGTYVVDNLTVANTGSLTLAPGVVVKFNQYGSLDINGSLVADGTTLNPIYFTSLNDDTADGEDTNADGPSVGAPGDWYYLNFGANSSNNLLNNVVVRYGGYGSYGSVYIATSSMTVENSTITQSNGQGIRLQASSGDGTIRIIDNDIIGNAGRGIWVYYSNGDFDIDIEGNTVFDNGQEGIYIGNSTVRTFDIINNSITENGYDGISVNNSTATGVSGDFAFINIDNNTIADNGYYGIRAISSTLSVTANEIFGHTDPYDGIYLDGDSFLNSTVAPNSPTPPDNNIHDNDLNVIIIGGTLSQAATWSSGTYVVDNLTVANTGSLTLAPGVVVKFNQYGSLDINGSLVADGTTLNPIYFTSLNDDTADGEDTNADGPSVGAPGDWYYLNFGANSSNNLLNNVVVRYGGYGSYGSVYIATSSMTVENSTITQSNGQGIRLQASSGDGTIRIIDNDIIGNAGRGIWVYYSNGDFDIDIEGNTVFDNGQEGIYIGNSTVRTFDIINNSITENGYDGISVNNSTATGVSGDFAFINIDNNTIADNGYYGIRAISSTLSVTANEIFGHTDPYDGIYLDGDSFLNSTVAPNSPTPPDNNIHDNDLNVIIIGGTLSQAATWSSGTYVVDNLTVANTGSLTLAPGVVVKFNQYGSLDINGSLVADGTTLNPIYFTSLNDDTADGEDTNADGPSVGAPGDWYYLNFGANSSNNLLNNVVVRYGGYGSYGSVYIATSSMTVENSTITQSNGQGIRLQASSGDGTIRIIDNDIIGNAGRGIWVYYSNGDFDIDIEGNTVFDNGQEGIYIGNSTVRTFDIINNSITENGYDGISVNNSTATGVSGDFAFINIDNNTIADNGYYGIRAISSTLSVTANEIFGHTDPYDGIYLDGDSFLNSTVAPNSPTPPDNNIHDNDLNVIIIGGTLSQAATWSSGTYVVDNLTVANTGSLTLAPGVVVKFNQYGSLDINGSLVADGTTLNPIYFTSLNDDTADGEDTNADGPSVGAPGDWYYLNFGANSSNNLLNNVVVSYGGRSSYESIYIATSSVTVRSSTIEQSFGYGIEIYNAAPIVSGNIIKNNNSGGIVIGGNLSVPTITNCIFLAQPYGIYSYYNANPTIGGSNTFYGNTTFAVYNASATVIEATNNYWGDPSGPYHPGSNPTGLGDPVSDNVNFGDWLTENPFNQTPVVSDIPDQTIDEGNSFATVNLDDYVTDADNADEAIDWTASGSTYLTVTIDANRVATIDIPANWSGSETITFTAEDPDGLSDGDSATFTVISNNDYDGDGVPNIEDNCPYVPNAKQTDTFPNSEGNACQGLIAYYPLTGNANDFSGYDNHGTVNGASLTSDRNGNSNSAFSFDGIDDLIQISDSDSLDIGFSDYTIVAWIMTEATTNTGRIFSKGSFGCSTGYMMRMGGPDSSRAFLENAFNSSCQIRFQSDTIINDNRWHLVVGVVDRDVGGKIYIDGNLDSQQVLDTSSFDLSNDNNPTIGQYDVGIQVEPFSGVIDEVRIYNRALSESEIQEIYTESLNYGLVAHYPFDGDANDISGNGNDGSVLGATLTADRFGNPNNAYNFDGVNDYIKASADNLPTAERTVSLWFFANTNDRMVHLGYGGSGPPGTAWFMGINGWGQSIFYMSSHYDNNTIKYFYSQPPVGAWYHFVAASDSNGTRLYINGVEEATNSNYVANTIVQNKDLSIGVCVGPYGTAPYVDANVGYFNGIIDDVRIYNRALSDAEIQTLSYKSASQIDTDGDGDPDITDPDDDNDNVADADDNDPLDNYICRDVDADGCDDCSSGIDDPADDGTDTDIDGMCDLGDPDDDNDGVPDGDDAFPLDPNETIDSDGDGIGDNSDNCPNDSNTDQTDSDGDGIGDVCESALEQGLSSTFDSDDEGWTTANDATNFTHNSSGGNPGGFISAVDIGTGAYWYFVAPATWHGDWTGYVGGTLQYDINVLSGSSSSAQDDVIIFSGADFLAWRAATLPGTGVWNHYEVQLSEANFTTSSGRTFSDIMSNVTALWIRGEYVLGGDSEGLDNVIIDSDTDGDGIPNIIDPDDDNDGVEDNTDNCPIKTNADQTDADGDGIGDVCDCASGLPDPVLIFTGETYDYTDGFGDDYTAYVLEVTNRSVYPDEFFAPAPHLPPCGANTNSARTWVDIYDQDDNNISGYCALTSSEDLNSISFSVPSGVQPPQSVYIILADRECDVSYTSNPATIVAVDTDGDDIPDSTDPDDDNDNVADGDDTDPLNANICRDVDADGCDDCTSGVDDPANDGVDTDGDGLCNLGDADADGDGFDSEAAGGTDCNDLNALVYPGAQEVPGDGIDQDCDGSDAVNIIPNIPYYVDPVNGTDDGAHGTANAAGAWKSLHYAIELINTGTPGTYTLELAAGTYNFTSEDNDTPIVLNQDMIIEGSGAIIDGGGDHGDAADPWITGLLIGPGAANMTISGLVIENFKDGIVLNSDGGCVNLAGVTVRGCETGLKVVDTYQTTVELTGSSFANNQMGIYVTANSSNNHILNGTVQSNSGDGIRLESAGDPPDDNRFEGIEITDNDGNGIIIYEGCGNEVIDCVITNNNLGKAGYGGVAILTGGTLVTGNSLDDNQCYGIYADDALSSEHLDATDNWWGAASGPGGAGAGTGDSVSEHVDYAPWSSNAPFADDDNDGWPNTAEEQAGTDPDDKYSYPQGIIVFYVGGPDGNNTNLGTEDFPLRSLHEAVGRINISAEADYTIYLATGTYDLGVEEDSPLVPVHNVSIIGPDPGLSAVIDGAGATSWTTGLIIPAGSAKVTLEDVTLRNFDQAVAIQSEGGCVSLAGVSIYDCITGLQLVDAFQIELNLNDAVIRNCETGVKVAAGSSNNVILNGIIRDNSGDGIRVGGDDEVPDENRFEGIQITDNGANGIIFYDGFDNLVTNCVISGNNNDETGQTGFAGIAVLTGNTKLVQNIIEANKCAGVYADEAASLEISGNLILGNKSEGIKLSFTTDVKIASNTITENQHGLVIEGGSSPEVFYNIIWDNIAKDLFGDGCTASLEYNDIGTRNLACLPFTSQMPASNISFDPRFGAAATGDYTLMSTSPCIDGTDFAEAGTDLAGYSRPKGNSWDIGAYESSGFADSDEDNLPDWWEQKIIDADAGDGIETPADVLPDDDFDGDGISNIDEYEAGTDPTTALEITIENPASSPFNTDSGSMTFSGTSANASQIVIRQNGAVVQTLTADLDAWSVPLSLAGGQNLISATAADGTHSITASATVMQDYQNPQISVTNPEIQGVYETTSATIVLSGLASDDTRVDSVTWSRTGWTNDLPVTISGAAAGTGSWTTTPIELVAGAANSITVTATDPWDKSTSVVVEVIMVQGIASQEEALPEPLPPPAADPLDLDQDGYLNNDEDDCGSNANDSDSIPANYGTTNGPAPNQYPTDESDALYDPNKVKRDANGDIIGSYLWPDCLNPDEDRDGMLDSCEEQIINANAQDGITTIADVLPGADFDQDGASNSAECQDGTDPTDAPAAEFMLRVLDVSNQAVYNSWLPGYQKVLKVQAQWQNGTAPATAVFSLQGTSKYPGRAENDPDPSATLTAYQPWYQYNGFDFGLTATDPATDQNIHSFAQGPVSVPGAGGIYTVYLQCWDYGARAKLVVTHPTNANIRSEVWIPKGAGANGISSNWIHDNAATRLQANADIDAIIFENPGGYTAPPGDGFNNFAEYRGILYRATIGSELLHLRLNPHRKNLFVLAEGYDDAIGDPYRPFDPPVGDGGQPQYDSYYPFRLGTALKNAGVDVLNITGWGHDATEDGSFFTYYKQGSVQGFLVAGKLVTGTGTGWAAHWPKREWQFRMAADVNAPWMPITSWGSATQLSLAFSYQGPSTSGAYLIRKPLPHINAVIIRHDRTSPSALSGKDGIINFQTAIPPSALNPDGTRYWNWDQKGHANTNSTEDHPTMYGFATTYQVPLDHYFDDRPYVEGTVWMGNAFTDAPMPDGKLAPLSRVEDRLDTLTPMDGVLGDSPDNYWDGDYRSDDQSAWFMAANQVSPCDIDGNGYVELPFASDPDANNYSKQYDFDGIPNTRARVLRDTATHELVHAIAGPPHSQVLNCLMYEESSSWSKDNYISDYIRALLRVHNFTR